MTILNEGFANETTVVAGGPESPLESQNSYDGEETVCVEDSQCMGRAGRDFCQRDTMETGEWRNDGHGPDDMSGITKCNLQEDGTMRNSVKHRDDCELVYFCGFET